MVFERKGRLHGRVESVSARLGTGLTLRGAVG